MSVENQLFVQARESSRPLLCDAACISILQLHLTSPLPTTFGACILRRRRDRPRHIPQHCANLSHLARRLYLPITLLSPLTDPAPIDTHLRQSKRSPSRLGPVPD